MGSRAMIRYRGFSLVELMVAMVVSLVLIGGAFTMFVQSSSSASEVQEQGRVQETLRLAMETIAYDLRMAGFTGCSKDTKVTSILEPAAETASGDLFNLANPIEGWDTVSKEWLPSGTDTLKASIAENNDAITLRYIEVDQDVTVDTQMPNTTNPVKIASSQSGLFENGDIIAITDCEETNVFGITNTVNNGNIAHGNSSPNSTNSLTKAFAPGSFIMRPIFKRYFIGDDGNGVPSLFVTAISSGTTVASSLLARGVERMEFRYGVDADNNNIADSYVEAASVTDWSSVISVRYAMLVVGEFDRSDGVSGPSTISILGSTFTPPAGDNRIRNVMESTVTIRNRSI